MFVTFLVFIYFPKCEGKGSFPKSQIKSLSMKQADFNLQTAFKRIYRKVKGTTLIFQRQNACRSDQGFDNFLFKHALF